MSRSNGSTQKMLPASSPSSVSVSYVNSSGTRIVLQMPLHALAIELNQCLVDCDMTSYRLALNSGTDVGNLHRLLQGERHNTSRETILRYALGLTLPPAQVDEVIVVINRLFDAAGLKTL